MVIYYVSFKGPWPKGRHREERFPCGVRYIDLIDERIHSEVPGHIVLWYICSFFIPEVPRNWREIYREPSALIEKYLPKCGDEARELLREAARYRNLYYSREVKTCINCPKANWDAFCQRIKIRARKRLKEILKGIKR